MWLCPRLCWLLLVTTLVMGNPPGDYSFSPVNCGGLEYASPQFMWDGVLLEKIAVVGAPLTSLVVLVAWAPRGTGVTLLQALLHVGLVAFVGAQRALYIMMPTEFEADNKVDLTNLVLSGAAVLFASLRAVNLLWAALRPSAGGRVRGRCGMEQRAKWLRIPSQPLFISALLMDVLRRNGTLVLSVGSVGIFLMLFMVVLQWTPSWVRAVRSEEDKPGCTSQRLSAEVMLPLVATGLIFAVQWLRPCRSY